MNLHKQYLILVPFSLLASLVCGEVHLNERPAGGAAGDEKQVCQKQWDEKTLLETVRGKKGGMSGIGLDGLFGKPRNANPLSPESSEKTDIEIDQEALRQLALDTLLCSATQSHNQSLMNLLTQAAVYDNSSAELKMLRQVYPPLNLLNQLDTDWKKAVLLQAKEFSDKGMEANLIESLKSLSDKARNSKSSDPDAFNDLYLLFEHPFMNLLLGADLRKAIVRRLTETPPETTELKTGIDNLGSPPPSFAKAHKALKEEVLAKSSADPKKRFRAARAYQAALAELPHLDATEKASIKSWLRELSHQIQKGEVASRDEGERNLLQDKLDEAYRAIDEGPTTLYQEARTWNELSETKKSVIEKLQDYLHASGSGELLGIDIKQLAGLTESELGTLLDYAKRPSSASDQHLKELLMGKTTENIRKYLEQFNTLSKKNKDPESQAFLRMMDRYFHDVLNASMTFENEGNLMQLSSHQKLKLARILAALSPQDPESISLVRSLLFGPGGMDQKLAYLSERMDRDFSKYPPRGDKPEILDSAQGKALEKKVNEALLAKGGQHVLKSPEEWVREILKKPKAQRTEAEDQAAENFSELEEIRTKRRALQEESALKAARLDPRIAAYEREFQKLLEKEQQINLPKDERDSLPASMNRVDAELKKLRAEQAELRKVSDEDQELGQEENASLERLRSLQRDQLYQLGDSGYEIDAINYLIEEAVREKILPQVGSRPGTGTGFGAADIFVQAWFDKEKARAKEPEKIDGLLAKEMERRKKLQGEMAPHLQNLARMGIKTIGDGLYFDLREVKERDSKVLYEALDQLKQTNPSLKKDFDAWVRETYLAAGAPTDSLVALNEHLAIKGDQSGKGFEIVPVTKELKAELQREVDELRKLVIDQPHLIKEASSFLRNAAAGLSRADAVLARKWLGLDTSHWDSSLIGQVVGAREDETGHITTSAQRKLEKSEERFHELLERVKKKGNLLVNYPSHEIAGKSHRFPANNLAQYFSDKQIEYAIFQGGQLKALDADLASLEETMRFTRDTAAITVATLGAGSLLGLGARSVGAVQAANRIAQLQALAGRAVTSQAPAIGNALLRGYGLAGANQILGGAYHYVSGNETQMASAIEAYQQAASKGEKPPKIPRNLDLDGDSIPDGLQGHSVSALNSLSNFQRYNQSAQNMALFLYGQGKLIGPAQRFLPSNPLAAQMAANVAMTAGQGFGQKMYYEAVGRPDLAPTLSNIGWSIANNLVWASPVDDAAVLFLSRFKGFTQLSLESQRTAAILLAAGTNIGWSGAVGASQELFSKDGFVAGTGQQANGAWDALAMSIVESLAGDTYAGIKSAQSSHAMGLAHVARRNPGEGMRLLDEIEAKRDSQLSKDLLAQLPTHLFPGRYQGSAGLSSEHEGLIRSQATLFARIHDLDAGELERRMKQATRREPLQNIIRKMKAEKASNGTP